MTGVTNAQVVSVGEAPSFNKYDLFEIKFCQFYRVPMTTEDEDSESFSRGEDQ